MAIRGDATGDGYSRAGLNTPHTIAFWVRIVTDRNDYSAFAGYNNGSQYFLGTDTSGTNLNFYNGSDNLGTNLVAGVWNHIAITAAGGSGANRTVYLNGVSNITATGDDVSGGTLWFFRETAGDFLNGRLAAIKAWSAVLTQAEIQAEMWQKMPTRTANIFGVWPLKNVTDGPTDYSGNGNSLTAAGTLATEDDPPGVIWSYPESWQRILPVQSPILRM